MNVWDIVSRDVFASLVKEVSDKSICQGETKRQFVPCQEQERTILEILPVEILQQILKYLTNEDLLTARLDIPETLPVSHDRVYRRGETPFEGLHEVRMTDLKSLHLLHLDNFGDEQLHELIGDTTGHLTELNLINLRTTGKDFERLNLINLKSLYVGACDFNDEWLLKLMHLRRLEQLTVCTVHFADNCPWDAFKHCTELELLNFGSSGFGKRTVSAMARYLPNLKRWVLSPNEDGLITDEAFDGLVTHTHLEEIVFDRVQLTDVGLRQIALLTPNLTELTVTVCSAGDETIGLVGQLASLVKLTLRGTRITNAGFAALQPRFGKLLELTIDSRLATVTALHCLVPTVKSVRQLNVRLGDLESDLYYCYADEAYSHLYMRRLPSDLAVSSLKRFKGATTITLEHMSICEQMIDDFRDSQSSVINLTMRNCEITEDLVAPFTATLTAVKDFALYEAHLGETVIQRFVEGVTCHGYVQRMSVENEHFPSNKALKAMIPMTSQCLVFEIRTFEYRENISFKQQNDHKEIWVLAGEQVDNDIILDIVKRLPEATILILYDSAVTTRGLAEVGSILAQLTTLSLKSSTLGDDAVAVIGQDFPSLINLALDCELITDDGLEALGKQMTTVTSLTIQKSAITDDGVRRLASKLSAITYMSLSENPKLTRELYDYLTATYPDLQMDTYSEPEVAEQKQGADGNGQEQQQLPAEAADVAGDVVGQDVNLAPPPQPEPGVPEENHVEDFDVVPEQIDPRPLEIPEEQPEENSPREE